MIADINVSVHRWPFRRLPLDETPKLVNKLQQNGIVTAWAGSFDGVLHQDIAAVNLRTTEECRQHGDGVLLPVGTINPMLPDWHDDVLRCRQDHGMQVILIYPNYHGYKLDDPVFEQLLHAVKRLDVDGRRPHQAHRQEGIGEQFQRGCKRIFLQSGTEEREMTDLGGKRESID